MWTRKKVGIVGFGRIGRSIAYLLQDKYDVSVFDQQFNEDIQLKVEPVVGSFTEDEQLSHFVAGKDAIVNASPYFANVLIAKTCLDKKVHYLDLSEDTEASSAIKQMAEGAQSAFVPNCGLAPGAVNIIANHLVSYYEQVSHVELRVGALPLYPNNQMKYYLTWSSEGLVNEYCNSCDIICQGESKQVPALADLEELVIDGALYEAFNTSGGIGSLCDSLLGKVENLNYKTIRYPGHQKYFSFLLDELNLRHKKDLLTTVLHQTIPHTSSDVVIVLVKVLGKVGKGFQEKTYFNKILGRDELSAIQLSTASGLCAMLDYVLENKLSGHIRQEAYGWEAYSSSEFGKVYLENQNIR